MMLQLLLAIAVILGSFEPFCTGQKAIDPGQWTKKLAPPPGTAPPASVCPPECPPGFVARETIAGGVYSCDQFSLGGSEGKEEYFFKFVLMSQFNILEIYWW